MTPTETAAAVALPISTFGTKFMLDPAFYIIPAERGWAGMDFYFVGRGGVLGECGGDIVAAAFGFMEPAMVRSMWDQGRSVAPVADAVALFAEGCADWGRQRFGTDIELDELASLAARVVVAADPSGNTLFTGWRSVSVPTDGAGAVALHLQTLREHRGGAHLMAVRAAGVTPLEAVLANGGEGVASFFGHQPPFPDVAGLTEQVAAAEEMTNHIAAQPYEALDPSERARFVELVGAVRAAIG